ncbi:MAG TPA: hypothetical protein VFT22_01600 [Kofleriaceae bacterium]|nr:hypothetical protein [Kofleriaceae bacterium]
MTGFTAASAAFREYALRALATTDIVLAPGGEARMPHTYGGAWAFNAAPSNHPERVVRGWATARGTVITPQQNFGSLLAEAGLWAKPRGDLSGLAAAIAWSLGNAYTAPGGIDVKIGADGAGTLTCYLLYQEGGGGGYVSPQVPVEVVITAARDHTATVKITRQP